MRVPTTTGRDLKADLHAHNLSVFGDACLIPAAVEPCDDCKGTGNEWVAVGEWTIDFADPFPCQTCDGEGVIQQ